MWKIRKFSLQSGLELMTTRIHFCMSWHSNVLDLLAQFAAACSTELHIHLCPLVSKGRVPLQLLPHGDL